MMRGQSNRFNRRELLAYFLAAGGMARAQESVTIPGKRPMRVHNDRPEDLETPVSNFDTWLMTNNVFFVRQHIPRPIVHAETFRLSVGGRVEKSIELTLADIQKLPRQRSCTPCHSLRLVDSQRLSRGAWKKEITKMTRWGAVVPDRELLLDYLSREYSDGKPVPKPELSSDGTAQRTKH